MIDGLDFVRLPVSDMARARSFYAETLGLQGGQPGPRGGIRYALGESPALELFDPAQPGEWMQAGPAASVGLAMRDFNGMVETLRGLDMLGMEPFETDGCHGGPAADSEGNPLVIHQRKEEPQRDRLIDFLVLPVEDMARARGFYEGELGLVLDSEGRGIWAEYVLPDGSALALFQGPQFEAASGGGVGLATRDVAGVFARLQAKGFAREQGLQETETATLGFVKDTEGNALVLIAAH